MRNLADGFGKLLSLAIRSGTALGALILLALALVLSADVLTTRILDHPIPGVIKLSEAGLVLLLFLGMAAATRNRGHIRVDILVARLVPRARRFYDAIGYLFAAVFFAVWTWQMWNLTAKSWAIREMATGLLPYPLYPGPCGIDPADWIRPVYISSDGHPAVSVSRDVHGHDFNAHRCRAAARPHCGIIGNKSDSLCRHHSKAAGDCGGFTPGRHQFVRRAGCHR